jgi:hypothetical protein
MLAMPFEAITAICRDLDRHDWADTLVHSAGTAWQKWPAGLSC